MAKEIEPRLRRIEQYLKLEKGVVFKIPEYQRAYSWEIEHCDKLWNDIVDYLDSEKKDKYFFGTIIISCDQKDDDDKYELIDGQQRTTTFFLLLKALLIRINGAINNISDDDDSESLKNGLEDKRRKIMGILYKVDAEDIKNKPDIEKDKEICKTVNVIDNYSILELNKGEMKKILQGVEYTEIEHSVDTIPYKHKDNKYTNYFRNFKFFYETVCDLPESKLNAIAKVILEQCEVIQIKSWDADQAINMFNSLNSDGLPLKDSDIISAKLYAAAEKIEKRDEFKELWEELLKRISELEQSGIADIDSILMQQMYYQRTIDGDTKSENGNIDVTTPGLRRYFTGIKKEILNRPVEISKEMMKLVNNWSMISNYPCVQVLLKFNENIKLFLASYLHRFDETEITEDKVSTVAESMLKLFTILELVDVGYSSKYFKTFLFGEEVRLADKYVTEQEIADDFNRHITSNSEKWSEELIKEKLLDYDKNMLVYLNEYLFAKEKNKKFNLGNKYDIEHIMPNSGKDKQIIRADAGIESEEEFRGVVNSLGNKILLEQNINRSIGNEWFRTKVSTGLKDKTGYNDSKYPIANALVEKYKNSNKPYWKKEDIYEATKKASKRIVDFIFGNN